MYMRIVILRYLIHINLGGRGYTEKLLNHKTLCGIATEHGKSSAQVILRRNLQKGVVVIPGSRNERHIR